MPKKSAGILLYRKVASRVEVLLAHPGGPFWAKKDAGAWSIPKGEIGDEEDPLSAAQREFAEETGLKLEGEMTPLEPIRQPGGKIVYAWTMERDWDAAQLQSNRFSLEWPPKSGRFREFPEIDRAGWFTLDEARTKILKGQLPLLDQLQGKLGRSA